MVVEAEVLHDAVRPLDAESVQHDQRLEHHIPTRHAQTTIEQRHDVVLMSAIDKDWRTRQTENNSRAAEKRTIGSTRVSCLAHPCREAAHSRSAACCFSSLASACSLLCCSLLLLCRRTHDVLLLGHEVVVVRGLHHALLHVGQAHCNTHTQQQRGGAHREGGRQGGRNTLASATEPDGHTIGRLLACPLLLLLSPACLPPLTRH